MRVKAWHFTGDKLRDGSPIPKIGKWLVHEGPVVWCESGLYASRDPFDALGFAPGSMLHLVECEQIEKEDSNKFVCRRRRIIASKDATEGLHYFARMQALSVVHLWNVPDVVLDYLMSGDGLIRDAARAYAWDAARAYAKGAAMSATWNAARVAARDAAMSATWNAARDAARNAARAYAWDAARAYAKGAARDAAWNAAWNAARANWNALVAEAFSEHL